MVGVGIVLMSRSELQYAVVTLMNRSLCLQQIVEALTWLEYAGAAAKIEF